ncbi:hypothetical protein LCGC14_2979490 [marine sediment metagenome]|uniref:Uncharacterized protein n=1 Tax=marine sediment metagenome TaxID=412755 RepID=A0A0F8ZY74_9ZZZZ
MAIDLHPKNELQWFKEGRVFQALHGVLSTGVIFETDLVRQTPDLLVRVPGGTVIVPLRVTVTWEVTAAAVAQCLISSCDNDPGNANMTQFTPVNLNTRFADETGSKVTAFVTSTGATGTAPTNVCDLYRMYVQPDIDAITGFAHFDQGVYSPLHGKGLPAVIGSSGSQINAFMVHPAQGAGGSPTGYVIATWAEFTFDEFYAE